MVNCVKRLLRSIVTFLSSNADVISPVSSSSASDVDIFVLNPHWLFMKM